MRVMVTGATGFVGRELVPRLADAGHSVIAVSRRDPDRGGPCSGCADRVFRRRLDLLRDRLDAALFEGLDAIVHLAAVAHSEEPADPDGRARVQALNCEAALELARGAAAAGVTRMLFVSSALVHGSGPFSGPIDEQAPLAPESLYARAKSEAERGLRAIAGDTGLAVTVLRPPLVYGPGASGNFARLRRWAEAGRPLPAPVARTRRSMIARANLCDALIHALVRPEAANRTFLVADAEDLTLGEVCAHLAEAAGTRSYVAPVPNWLLKAGLSAIGRGSDIPRLLGEMRLDTREIRDALHWTPPYDARSQLRAAVFPAGTERTTY